MDYEKLKAQLKGDVRDKARSFAEVLSQELHKVNSFYSSELERLRIRVQVVEENLEEADGVELTVLCEELDRLRRYTVLNAVAIIKIVKKRNKVLLQEGAFK